MPPDTPHNLIQVPPNEVVDPSDYGLRVLVSKNTQKLYVAFSLFIEKEQFQEILRDLDVVTPLDLKIYDEKEKLQGLIAEHVPILIADQKRLNCPMPDLDFFDNHEEIRKYFAKRVADSRPKFPPKLPLILVKPGIIARKLDAARMAELLSISDVFGNVFEHEQRKIVSLKPGKGVSENEKGEIISSLEGCLEIDGESLSVSESFRIDNVEDWRSGDLHFSGSVEVGSQVIQNFGIYAGGDIIIHGTSEGANLKSGGNLVVKEGIIGETGKSVESEKNIEARYANQADIFCHHDCEFKSGLFHSSVLAHGKLVVKGGALVGGLSYGAYGVEAKELGGPGAVKTEVCAGFCKKAPYSLDNVMHEIKSFKEILDKLSENVNPYLEKPDLHETLAAAEKKVFLQTLAKLKHLKTRIKELSVWLQDHDSEKCQNSKIRVIGKVYTGVLIRINNFAHEVKTDTQHVEYFVDWENRKIGERPLR